ncbi:MAG: T9SS type A sorting domain-containing protein, partial [Flavobacteriales bacterium]
RWSLQSASGTVSDLVSVYCYDPDMPQADAGPDQSVPLWLGSAQLDASPPSGLGECFWSVVAGSGTFSDPAHPQATVSGLAPGLNVLRWSCFNGPCGNSADAVAIDAVVGIDEPGPEPAMLHLAPQDRQLRSLAPARIQVADAMGRIVLSGTASPSQPLSIAPLPAGSYLARALRDGGASTLRFVLD